MATIEKIDLKLEDVIFSFPLSEWECIQELN
jgi:hypothetical protein